MTLNFKNNLLIQGSTIKEAIERINNNKGEVLIICDSDQRLVGSLSDGDIRRALLKGFSLDSIVKDVMNTTPKFIETKNLNSLIETFEETIIPVIDENNKIINIINKNYVEKKSTPVLIMAGGLGTRLGDLTKKCPKPMLKVGNKTLLEHIIGDLKKHGFYNFYLAVNYLAEVIEEHFGTGEDFDCNIQYLKEDKRLGTAGPISLLPDSIDEPFVVMNADLLTNVNFSNLLEFSKESKSGVTMCVRNYEMQVPYGVIKVEEGHAKSFVEKPVEKYKVNAGIYVISNKHIPQVPKNKYYDMSSFLNELLDQGYYPRCYDMIDSWIDIGKESELNRARDLYDS